ncbi:hypothetical protein JVU11DRAFT_556 [Chiua virens]|nr:hypothetical protein JVU11DRAFT_556 [Chiua virens]
MASASEPSTFLRRWNNLLAWLEGHGFQAQNLPVECREMAHAGNGLFARSAFQPGRLLFVVPPKVLMNKMTLKRLYPPDIRVAKALTAVQLISMHLFIWRPKADEDSADPDFGPYISILPRDFGGHPLTWVVQSKLGKVGDQQSSLLSRLPPGALAGLDCLHSRFWDDWCKVRTLLRRAPSIAAVAQGSLSSLESHETIMDFLWAWLNVNTRCIYSRLKPSKADPDNLTMCPILDFANHTSGQANMSPVPSKSEIWNAAPVNPIGDGVRFVSPDNVKIEDDDEILLTYGLHSNKTLFVEYGFVNLFSEDGPSPSGEVDVQGLAEKHIFAVLQLGEAVKAVLVAEGYWGNWTLHWTPDSCQPSWQLITALRLYHHVAAVGSVDEKVIQPWRDVVTGRRPQLSCENEQSWRKTVVLLCDMLIQRAENCIVPCSLQGENGMDSWAHWMSENIRTLWREEMFVAKATKESILRGDEF